MIALLGSTAFEVVNWRLVIQRFEHSLQSPDHRQNLERSALPVTVATWRILHAGSLQASVAGDPSSVALPWWAHVHAGSPEQPQAGFPQDTDGELTGYLWISPSLPCFTGHFPGAPILPGVVQLQWAIELAAAIWPSRTPAANFCGSSRVKFKAPVLPAGLIRMNLRLLDSDVGLSLTLSDADQVLTSATLRFSRPAGAP